MFSSGLTFRRNFGADFDDLNYTQTQFIFHIETQLNDCFLNLMAFLPCLGTYLPIVNQTKRNKDYRSYFTRCSMERNHVAFESISHLAGFFLQFCKKKIKAHNNRVRNLIFSSHKSRRASNYEPEPIYISVKSNE